MGARRRMKRGGKPSKRDVRRALDTAIERGYVRELPGGQYEITEAGEKHYDRLAPIFGGQR